MKRLFFLFLPLSLMATPAQVLLMRHAETSQDSSSLTLKGRERATALDPFFQGNPTTLFYGLPTAIFAKDYCKETVAPLSKAIHISITDHYSTTKALSSEILTNPDFEGKMVLVCTTAEEMVDLAKLLGAKKAPKKLAQNAYDRLWAITFEDNEKIAFNDLPQKLLYNDSDK